MPPKINSSFSSPFSRLLAGLIIPLLLLDSPALGQQDFYFEGSLSGLREEARKKDSPFVVEIMADWCGYCRKFESRTMKDARVVDYFEDNEILFFSIDGEKGDGVGLSSDYKVTGFPTILFFSPDGQLIKRVNGYQPPSGFLVSLKEFSSSRHMGSEVLSYLDLKQKYFDDTYTVEKIWPEKHCIQAYALAMKDDEKGFQELILELGEDESLIATLVFLIYSRRHEKVPEYGWKCFGKELLNETQQHFLSFYVMKNQPDFYLSHQLINASLRSGSSLDKLDTRAGVEYLSGNKGDASSTAKKIKKSSNGEKDLPTTYSALIEMINSGKN